MKQKEEADEEEIYNTIQSLKKLVHLYTFNDLTSLRLYDKVFEIQYNSDINKFNIIKQTCFRLKLPNCISEQYLV